MAIFTVAISGNGKAAYLTFKQLNFETLELINRELNFPE